ncbi:hypothetical protein Ga0466249_004518 [Sporomusaceae bacterium BoRhaA]|nr:hypothetical protein [Pelorhabdus rhamnosifermentans]MBU2703373.1 hypothetical protein [Pelorhabdus rhamnosifermentans]
MVIKHECGGNAHSTGGTVVIGWNKFLCGRCGEVFYKWITTKMLERMNQ